MLEIEKMIFGNGLNRHAGKKRQGRERVNQVWVSERGMKQEKEFWGL